MRGLSLLVLACSLCLSGCGEEGPGPGAGAPDPKDAPAPDWSLPEADGAPEHATWATPEEALAHLSAVLVGGTAAGRVGWEEELRRATELLYDVSEPDEGLRVHLDAARIAAEVSGWLAAGPEERERVTREHPTDLAVHDALIAHAARGVSAYREWTRGAGAALLARLAQERRERLFGR